MRRLGEQGVARPRRWLRRLALLAAARRPASADARICRQLEAELASTGRRRRVVAVQEIRPRRRRAARPAVDGAQPRPPGRLRLLLPGDRPAMCAPLNAQIERMERNLDALERKRGAAVRRRRSRRDRARILASLDANDCRDTAVAEREPPRERNGSSLFDRLFGGGVPEGLPVEEPERPPFERTRAIDGASSSRRQAPPTSPASSTRTAKSRSSARPASSPPCACAPATAIIFPMSPNSSSADFDRDLKNCESDLPRHRDAALLPATPSARNRRR